ncbi:MAG TPA: type II toxin-antitoxin system VapC family toxin [Candidatus Eremiobacteraceae bacterium]|nr:type II toxin-antitoxin system VapC family toxin [Candidatus Eremiobacteraceae bacterium]
MKILIDTHVLLWGLQDEEKLSRRVQTLLPGADVWISVASLWEIITKVQVGKLTIPTPVGDYLSAKLKANGVLVLQITFDHVKRVEGLPLHHRDPFDRILIAQSLNEKIPIVTSDPLFAAYPVEVIW